MNENNKKDGPSQTRVIQMHQNQKGNSTAHEPEIKYSALLLKLISPFTEDIGDKEELEIMLDLGIVAWNLANLKNFSPEIYKLLLDQTKGHLGKQGNGFSKLVKMIELKQKTLPEYDWFLSEFSINEDEDDTLHVTVVAKTAEAYLEDLGINAGDEFEEDYEEETYIDRTAFMVKPKTAFLNWVSQITDGSTDTGEFTKGRIYLAPMIFEPNELSKWLKKNFDTIFSIELNGWSQATAEWPQKRTYKMFNDWFSVEQYSDVIDLEDYDE